MPGEGLRSLIQGDQHPEGVGVHVRGATEVQGDLRDRTTVEDFVGGILERAVFLESEATVHLDEPDVPMDLGGDHGLLLLVGELLQGYV